jgi:hypothetical protein
VAEFLESAALWLRVAHTPGTRIAPVLEFLIKRGEKIVLDDATEGLRKRILG